MDADANIASLGWFLSHVYTSNGSVADVKIVMESLIPTVSCIMIAFLNINNWMFPDEFQQMANMVVGFQKLCGEYLKGKKSKKGKKLLLIELSKIIPLAVSIVQVIKVNRNPNLPGSITSVMPVGIPKIIVRFLAILEGLLYFQRVSVATVTFCTLAYFQSNVTKVLEKMRERPLGQEDIGLYHSMQILTSSLNSTFRKMAFPSILSSFSVLFVVNAYVGIRQVSSPVIQMLKCLLLIAVARNMHESAGLVHFHSSKILSAGNSCSEILRRQIRSLWPLRIYVGSQYHFERMTIFWYLQSWLDHSITALMLF
ncbi:unnamed protein product [Allacma fusca]|uniref:Uncharacterized protein n=1 Tax=Allacma fusca TaxID=39272 RepID=A0A8J2LY01_9HEXA|nr:unnamed protein product [Allacma fusca]